jgi:hypothetical protein
MTNTPYIHLLLDMAAAARRAGYYAVAMALMRRSLAYVE